MTGTAKPAKRTATKVEAAAAKPAAKATAAAKPAPPAETAPKAEALRLKDFSDRVAAAVGARRNTAKPVIEATLRLLGDALEAGETLILPPLGRAKVSRSRDTGRGAALTVKLKRLRGAKAGADPLADDDEQG